MFVMAVGLLSILTNGVLLFILVKDPLKCFKASTTYFIISLSFSDLLTGANACLWAVDKIFPFSNEARKYMLAIFWITVQASFLTLVAMSAERFLIVKYPLYCRMWITKRRVSLFIALIWFVSAILGGQLVILPLPKQLYVQFSIYTEFFISVFVIAALYVFILLGIRNSQKAFQGNGGLHAGGGGSFRETSFNSRTASPRLASCRVNVSSTAETSEAHNNNGNSLFPEGAQTPRIIVPEINAPEIIVPGTIVPEMIVPGTIAPGTIVPGTPESRPRKTSLGETTTVGDKYLVVGIPGRRNSGQECGFESGGSPRNGDGARKKFLHVAQNILKTREKSRNIQQENKLTAVVLLLVGVLALTVLPYLLASQIIVAYYIFCKCPVPEGLMKFSIIYFPIELLNFAVNPLIYAWRLPQYRRTLKYLCARRQNSGCADTSVAYVPHVAAYRGLGERMRKQ